MHKANVDKVAVTDRDFMSTRPNMADSRFNYEIDHKEIVDEICPKLDELDLKFSREIRTYIGSLEGKVQPLEQTLQDRGLICRTYLKIEGGSRSAIKGG